MYSRRPALRDAASEGAHASGGRSLDGGVSVETAPAQHDESGGAGAVSLADIAGTFLLIGTIGFGGGMAIVALIQQICVERKRWMSIDEFTHGIALGQFLGAFAVNTATFVGYRMRGIVGAAVAAVALLTPGVVLLLVVASLYFRYSHAPVLEAALRGIGPVVLAIILSAAMRMGRGRMNRPEPMIVALAACGLMVFVHAPVLAILAATAVYSTVRYRMRGTDVDA